MISKISSSPTNESILSKKYNSTGSKFMSNVFKKLENYIPAKTSTEDHKFESIKLVQSKPANKTRVGKQSIIVPTKDVRVNSYSRNQRSFTPNSKSFDISQKPTSIPTSPENSKIGFLMSKSKIKTIVGKNLFDQKTKISSTQNERLSPDKSKPQLFQNKVSSSRTSPHLNKLASPLLAKVVSKEKSSPFQIESNIVNKNQSKQNLKTPVSNFLNYKNKLTKKLIQKNNKENIKDDENSNIKTGNGHANLLGLGLTKYRLPSKKNCMFAEMINEGQICSDKKTKNDYSKDVFEMAFADKLNPQILESNYNQVLKIYGFLMNQNVTLEDHIEEYVKTLRHPFFIDFSSELKKDSHLARAFEIFIKYKIIFVLYLVPLNHLSPKNDQLRKAYEALCLNFFCLVKTIKNYIKIIGKNSLSTKIKNITKNLKLPLLFKVPANMFETVCDNNTYLLKTIRTQISQSENKIIKKTLSKLLAKATDENLSHFISYSLEELSPFFEKLEERNSKPESIQTVSNHDQREKSLTNTQSSMQCDEEDPYFILQPLKIEKYLPDRKIETKRITMVLDLDETLVHFTENENNGKFLVRPFAREFLIKLSQHFEVVVFTAALKDYADWILDRIDTAKSVKYRLYRDHTTFQNGTYLKDLSKLNRDLSAMIIVDNNPDNFQMHPENGIYIKSWYEDPNDTALKHLANLLIKVANSDEKDVRIALSNYNKKMTGHVKETILG